MRKFSDLWRTTTKIPIDELFRIEKIPAEPDGQFILRIAHTLEASLSREQLLRLSSFIESVALNNTSDKIEKDQI